MLDITLVMRGHAVRFICGALHDTSVLGVGPNDVEPWLQSFDSCRVTRRVILSELHKLQHFIMKVVCHVPATECIARQEVTKNRTSLRKCLQEHMRHVILN